MVTIDTNYPRQVRRGLLGLTVLFCTSCGGDSAPADGKDASTEVDADITAPAYVLTSPAADETGVSRYTDITVEFDESVVLKSAPALVLVDSDGLELAGTVTVNGAVVTLSLDAGLVAEATYTARIDSGIEDSAGNPFAEARSWSFQISPRSWGSAEIIEPIANQGSWDPKLGVDDLGNALVVWQRGSTNIPDWSIWANRYSAGNGWGTAHKIETNEAVAAYPDVATDSAGNGIAVWYQEINGTETWSNRYQVGSGWGTAQVTLGNSSDFPKIEMNASGTALAIAGRQTIRYQPGTGWEASELPVADFGGQPTVALDGSGNALAVFRDGIVSFDIWFSRLAVNLGWASPEPVENNDNLGEASQPQLAGDLAGNATAVWSQEDPGFDPEWSIWANHYAPLTGWGTPEIIDSNALDAWSPKVARDDSGRAMVVWEQSDGVRFSVWARRYDPIDGWGTAEAIESQDGEAGAPEVALDADGNALVVWLEHDGTRLNIMSRVHELGEGWGDAELVEQNSSGDARSPQIALDLAGNAVVVWEQSDGANTRIWSNRRE